MCTGRGRGGGGVGTTKLGKECWCLVPTGGFCLCWRAGTGNGGCQLLCSLKGSPHDSCLSGPYPEVSKLFSLLSTAGVFQTAGSVLDPQGLFILLSL